MDSKGLNDVAYRYGKAWVARDRDATMALPTEDTVFQMHGAGGVDILLVRDGLVVRRDTSADWITYERQVGPPAR